VKALNIKNAQTSRLSRKQRLAFNGALVTLFLIKLALKFIKYRHVCRMLQWLSPSPNISQIHSWRVRITTMLVERAAHHHWIRATCLHRSLTLWVMLRWQRIPSTVRMGVNSEGAHAWVESPQGHVLNDRQDVVTRYQSYGDCLTPEQISGFT